VADLADIPDVESRWRPLRGTQEPVNAAQWLTDASAALRVQVDGLDEMILLDEAYGDVVTYVVAMAVVRMFRGRDPNDPADFSAIFFTKGELDALTSGGATSGSGAFTITPVGADVGTRYGAEADWWATVYP
jgi:hypothetical protein